jgi:hypothetical protein
VPDLQIGTALYELKGIRSDRSHSNCNGAQVTGVEKIPMDGDPEASGGSGRNDVRWISGLFVGRLPVQFGAKKRAEIYRTGRP